MREFNGIQGQVTQWDINRRDRRLVNHQTCVVAIVGLKCDTD